MNEALRSAIHKAIDAAITDGVVDPVAQTAEAVRAVLALRPEASASQALPVLRP